MDLALVGDVHGNLAALNGLWTRCEALGVSHGVFLGDYINKGPNSAEVLERLISLNKRGQATLLAGNHETALLDALDERDLSTFLKMGGAMTIRSYVGTVGPDVFGDFTKRLPDHHIAALRQMPLRYETGHLVAQHVPPTVAAGRFVVSAHVPVGSKPRINEYMAQLDTGCGSPEGRLTALLWPSLRYIQVNVDGDEVI